jgi:hypothetical protein
MRGNIEAAHVGVVRSLTVHSRDNASRHAVGGRERKGAVVGRWRVQRRLGLRVITAV